MPVGGKAVEGFLEHEAGREELRTGAIRVAGEDGHGGTVASRGRVLAKALSLAQRWCDSMICPSVEMLCCRSVSTSRMIM